MIHTKLYDLKYLVWFGLVWWHINHCTLFNPKSIFIHINSSISNNSVEPTYSFCLHILKCKSIIFQTIEYSISTHFSSIWLIDRTLSGATTPGQNGPGCDGNEGALCILQSSSITGASPSDCFMSYKKTRWGSLSSLQRCSRYILQP